MESTFINNKQIHAKTWMLCTRYIKYFCTIVKHGRPEYYYMFLIVNYIYVIIFRFSFIVIINTVNNNNSCWTGKIEKVDKL